MTGGRYKRPNDLTNKKKNGFYFVVVVDVLV